jgi:hypothetical protein
VRLLPSFLVAIATLSSTSLLLGCNHEQPPPPKYPVQPPAPGMPMVSYRFPFNGKWHVHRTHYGAPQKDQVWAMDVVPDTRVTDGNRNSGYPCYNQPILADAPGFIATTVDGIPENTPNQPNVYDQHGNYVVIDHRNGEYSLFAHMIPGSLKVRVGMYVQPGMELGRCGNSGLSTWPHIHWQVMDNVNASIAKGIRQRLLPYERNGKISIDMPDAPDTLENK